MQYLVSDEEILYEVVTVNDKKRPFGGYQQEYVLRNVVTEEIIFKLWNVIENWTVITTNEEVSEVSQDDSSKKVTSGS